MRISDWSSDVCSSDLGRPVHGDRRDLRALPGRIGAHPQAGGDLERVRGDRGPQLPGHQVPDRVLDPGPGDPARGGRQHEGRSEEHTSELQSLMRISYDVLCLQQQSDDIMKYTDYE